MAQRGNRTQGPSGWEEDLELLKEALRVRFPEGGGLCLESFLDVESVLTLALEVGGGQADATQCDRLLSNYALLRPEAFGAAEHLMQTARRALLHMSSGTAWRRHLDLYLQERYSALRLYDVDGAKVVERDGPFGGLDRRRIYLARMRAGAVGTSELPLARAGERYWYFCKPEGSDGAGLAGGSTRLVTIPQAVPTPTPPVRPGHKGPRERVDVTLDELIAVAEDVGAPAGRGHMAEVLRRVRDQGLLKRVAPDGAAPCGALSLQGVVNLVGLVGAGKSVLTDALVVALARRGLRVVTLLNSVSDVMSSLRFYRAAGVEASPLVSRSDRVQRINELFGRDGSMLLDDDVARYLETPCVIDGLSAGEAQACSYADTPCFSLRSAGSASHACPYWDVCPSAAMAREAAASEVVVTTPAGFSMMVLGKGRGAFFEHALADFDVAIFDEADRVQSQLDGSFAPEMSFQDLIWHSADPTAEAMKRPPEAKMADLDEERFLDLRQRTDPVAKSLLLAVRSEEVAGWGVVRDEAFTSLTLVDSLEEQGLPGELLEDLAGRVQGRGSGNDLLDHAVAVSCLGTDERPFQFALDLYLSSKLGGRCELDGTLRARLSFTLKVMGFDEFLRELADSSDFLLFRDESTSELYNFLRFSHVRQQRWLPSSLIGNMFGMRMTERNDLVLFRQFAFGRAFMECLPWLDTDEEGNPAGPHALLLSGSSYEPGCLRYHVNRPVDYLLEAQPWVAEKLSESRVCDLGIRQNVSGSGLGRRSRNLKRVLYGLASTLCAELSAGPGKALVIVNSYREAEYARDRLESALRGWDGGPVKVSCLTRTPREERDKFVPRSEVYRFAGHEARVLVAPAMSIERGFNIVDDSGSSTFTSLFFCVRPMGTPHDLKARFGRLNGLMEQRVGSLTHDAAAFPAAVRSEAWACWKGLERDERMPLSSWRATGRDALVRDSVATLLVTIVQIFGRLARIGDPERPAPHVYFADGAFRGPDDERVPAFRTLEELGRYMEWLMEESEQPAVARALYGPFYQAFKEGIG